MCGAEMRLLWIKKYKREDFHGNWDCFVSSSGSRFFVCLPWADSSYFPLTMGVYEVRSDIRYTKGKGFLVQKSDFVGLRRR